MAEEQVKHSAVPSLLASSHVAHPQGQANEEKSKLDDFLYMDYFFYKMLLIIYPAYYIHYTYQIVLFRGITPLQNSG